MVHALTETWRVSRGVVLDVRPRPGEPQVLVCDAPGREWACGSLPWSGDLPEGHPQAEAALAQVVAQGWFAVAGARQFDWVDTFATADELAETVHEDWSRTLDEDTALKLMRAMEQGGRGAVSLIRQAIGVKLLRKLPRPAQTDSP